MHCIVADGGALQPQSNVISQTSFKKRAKRDENEEKVGKIHGCLRSAGAVRESPSSPLIQFSSHIQHCSYLFTNQVEKQMQFAGENLNKKELTNKKNVKRRPDEKLRSLFPRLLPAHYPTLSLLRLSTSHNQRPIKSFSSLVFL